MPPHRFGARDADLSEITYAVFCDNDNIMLTNTEKCIIMVQNTENNTEN